MRFLLTPRWLGFLLAVAVMAGVCVWLGEWQWGKREDRRAENALIREHLSAAPVPLDEVVPAGEPVPDDAEWTQVRAEGRYDVASQLTVKFATRDGAPGADVVTPLLLDDGTALLVDRGWLATDNTGRAPDDVPEPPAGRVEVEGWLRVDNQAGPEAVVPAEGQVRAISSEGLADSVPYPLRSGFLDLREQTGGTDGLRLEPVPDLGGGPHFFYGLQWWFFGGLAVLGFVWFARLEAKDRREAQASETSSA